MTQPTAKKPDLFLIKYFEAGLVFSLYCLVMLTLDKESLNIGFPGTLIAIPILFTITFFFGYFAFILVDVGMKMFFATLSMFFTAIQVGGISGAMEKMWQAMRDGVLNINEAILKLLFRLC